MGDLEWTNDLAIRLMEEYKKRPELWDSSHEMFRVQTLKYESWSELANMFDCDIGDLRKKLNSLFASHRREKAKIRGGGRTTWFLYPYMSFLPNHLDPDNRCMAVTNEPTTKPRPPIKEVLQPEQSSEEEYLEEDDSIQEEVYIKEEPVMEHYVKPRAKPRKQDTHKPRLRKPIVKRRIVNISQAKPKDNIGVAEAVKLFRRTDLAKRRDECDSFGEYIAESLRKHDERTQSMIKHAINNILFEQEMKKYNTNQYTVVLSGIDENPLILGESEVDEK